VPGKIRSQNVVQKVTQCVAAAARKGGWMDEVSTRAKLVDSTGSDPGLTFTLPRSEVDEALQAGAEESELLLDVVQATNGHKEQRRVAVAWDPADLERLAREVTGERITLAIDPESLEEVLRTDVEAHGIRQRALALSIVAVTAGATVGGAQGAVDQFGGASAGTGSDPYAQIESVRAGTSATDPAAGIENVRAAREAPEAALDSYAAIEQVRGVYAADPDSGIENVRAERQAPAGVPDPSAAIENVRAGGSAVSDSYAGIENVRADRTAAESGGGGITVSAPSPGEGAAIAGVAALTIAGAAFALRRRREPRPA
jgi:MYXO-CTERM domain-containing protein